MRTVLATLLIAVAGCSGDDAPGPLVGPGSCVPPTLEILSPMDGATVGPADDIDLMTPGTQIEFLVEACGFESDDMIKLYILVPVESDYGFGMVDDGTLLIRAPLDLPGTNTFEARSLDDTIRSAPISLEVSL